MIRINAIVIDCIEIDEIGAEISRQVTVPQTPIPANAVRTECDGVIYTVYEPGD